MRALLQRVTSAAVSVDGETVGQIDHGWLILLGVGKGDSAEVAEALADKIVGLRCFEDEDGKTNISIRDVGGSVLLVSQFTLYADTSRGRRPGFSAAAEPEVAERLVAQVGAALRGHGLFVAEGRFGEHMEVRLTNDGPFTIWLDTAAP